MVPAIFAVFGLVIGSFLNVVVYRLPRRLSLVAPGSSCPRCGRPIAPWDNVPVVSFVLLRGRCRHCGEPISPEYPIVEAATAGLFALAAIRAESVGEAALVAPFLGVMLAVGLIDARHRIIPNRLLYPSLVLFAAGILGAWAAGVEVSPARAGLGLLATAGPLLAIAVVMPHGMGMGDVKLAAVMGLVLGGMGWDHVVVGAVLGVLLGGLGSATALLLGRSRKDTIPFGPFLAAGAALSALFADPIASWYTSRLG
jgi:leader peptidase (prepilin peptidase) / N-methyltransferase